MFLTDVEIANFKDDYSDDTSCGGNKVFRNHPVASDATAGHYLTRVTCTNCEEDAFAFIMDPNPEWRGWFGGCGDMDCTGLENVLI